MNNKTQISIIVPAYNEAPFIEGCLDSLVYQQDAVLGSDYEIIVVNDGSRDETAARVGRYPVTLINLTENHGKIYARKIGAEHARYEILLFIDAKVRASNDVLKNFRSIGYAPLIAGGQLEALKDIVNPDERLFYLIRRRYYFPFFPLTEDNKSFSITKENFLRAPKGTTCFFVQKNIFLGAVPSSYDKYTNDDTTILHNIIVEKGIAILKHYDVKVTYVHRTGSRELSEWILRRGITFFDFYINRSRALRALFIVSLFVDIGLFVYALLHPVILVFCIVAGSLLYAGVVVFLIEKKSDVGIVAARFWRYVFVFYAGLVRGWFMRLRRR